MDTNLRPRHNHAIARIRGRVSNTPTILYTVACIRVRHPNCRHWTTKTARSNHAAAMPTKAGALKNARSKAVRPPDAIEFNPTAATIWMEDGWRRIRFVSWRVVSVCFIGLPLLFRWKSHPDTDSAGSDTMATTTENLLRQHLLQTDLHGDDAPI